MFLLCHRSPEAQPGDVPDAEKFPENPAADLEPVLLRRVCHQLRVHVNLPTVHIGHCTLDSMDQNGPGLT